VIGAGVLTLPWVMAQMGWILGVSYIIIIGLVTVYTSNLLADCYRTPDPVTGKRNHNYMEAVKNILGMYQNLMSCFLSQIKMSFNYIVFILGNINY
jgi:amino acid permease